MKRDDIIKYIRTLESYKRANQHARLAPGDERRDGVPRGWWVRDE